MFFLWTKLQHFKTTHFGALYPTLQVARMKTKITEVEPGYDVCFHLQYIEVITCRFRQKLTPVVTGRFRGRVRVTDIPGSAKS